MSTTPPNYSPLPDRSLIERLIGHLRTRPAHPPVEPPAAEPALDDRPTDPVRPDRMKIRRMGTSSAANRHQFPEGSLLLLRSGGHKVLLENMHRDLVIGCTPVATSPLLPVRRVDVTYFSGYRSGMSRVHALLRRTTGYRIQLVDLDSTNGTFVNRSRVTPFIPIMIGDGDEIQMGLFVMQVSFIYP